MNSKYMIKSFFQTFFSIELGAAIVVYDFSRFDAANRSYNLISICSSIILFTFRDFSIQTPKILLNISRYSCSNISILLYSFPMPDFQLIT